MAYKNFFTNDQIKFNLVLIKIILEIHMNFYPSDFILLVCPWKHNWSWLLQL
jgi:hypothetical protein